MLNVWTANIANDPDKKASFEEYLRNNVRLLDRLKEILTDKEKLLDRAENTMKSYEDNSWSFKQAHINGRRAELAEMKQLITIG